MSQKSHIESHTKKPRRASDRKPHKEPHEESHRKQRERESRTENRMKSGHMKNHRLHTVKFIVKYKRHVKRFTSDSTVSCVFLPHRRCHRAAQPASKVHTAESERAGKFCKATARPLAKSTTYTVKQRYQIFCQKKSDCLEENQRKF